MALWAAALAALLAANAGVFRAFAPPYPAPDAMHLEHSDAVQAAGLMSLGMRRLAADLAFVRLLMYYGGADEEGREYEGRREGMGRYPQIGPRAMRILDLDPYFSYAAEYASAALAFNMNQDQAALDLLRYALARDPKNWKYHGYVAAIGFKRQGDPARVRDELATIADDPEAPTMLRHILAFLDRRLGRRDEAIRLYRQIARSRDKDYSALALKALREMGAEP